MTPGQFRLPIGNVMAPTVICCGLSCVDMELHSCNRPKTIEAITKFSDARFTAGGSAPQTARALVALSIPTAALTVVGSDPHGNMLRDLLVAGGVDPSAIVVNPSVCTALAVLPLFEDGTRGCFVTLGANLTASVDDYLSQTVIEASFTERLCVFHFGYPHLMPNLQGDRLKELFDRVRAVAPNVMLTMDVNGADTREGAANPVLLPALEVTAAVHANLEEACVISGLASPTEISYLSAAKIRPIVQWFTDRGVGIACITCGKDGVFAATGGGDKGMEWARRLRLSPELERGAFVHRSAFQISDGVTVNASGAGDAFTAGVISELAGSRGEGGVARVADAGLVGALHRLDPSLTGSGGVSDIPSLLQLVRGKQRLAPRPTLNVDLPSRR